MKNQEEQLTELKKNTAFKAWTELHSYFEKKTNGVVAKVACIVIGTLAREEQSKNNARQLDIIERRLNANSNKMIAK